MGIIFSATVETNSCDKFQMEIDTNNPDLVELDIITPEGDKKWIGDANIVELITALATLRAMTIKEE